MVLLKEISDISIAQIENLIHLEAYHKPHGYYKVDQMALFSTQKVQSLLSRLVVNAQSSMPGLFGTIDGTSVCSGSSGPGGFSMSVGKVQAPYFWELQC